ncbi:DUF397 domain-containing protein [Amycolatopsis nigrescens]|uniref:DUF397 domain-containing protein n=1 Tax=Amycolatopsis nigrescens TaxID=381445 RepID=UPI000374C442|nr:DUF397 domain-containing protein [Amycolatopsis nigrescens]
MSDLVWHKSSYSGNQEQSDCVEVAFVPFATLVRDSKRPAAGHLDLPALTWRAFLTTLGQG